MAYQRRFRAGYRQIETAAGGIAGGIWPAPPGAPSFVQLFVGVADVEQAVAQYWSWSARIVPPTVLPDGDAMAGPADPGAASRLA